MLLIFSFFLKEFLKILPAAVPIKHDKIGVRFERFDGRRYLPNAENKAQFPEDEAVTLSLIRQLRVVNISFYSKRFYLRSFNFIS
jgi:hypothetical protein